MAVSPGRDRSRQDRVADALPVLAAAGVYAYASRGPWAATALSVLTLASLWWGRKLSLSPVVGAAITGGAASLTAIFVPLEWLQFRAGEGPSELSLRAAAGLVLFAALRLYVLRPAGGNELSLAALLGAAVACGQAPGSWPYPALVAGFLVTVATSLVLRDGVRHLRHVGMRRMRYLLFGLGTGVAVAGIVATSLPWLHAQVVRTIYGWERRGAESGFSDDILLGAAADITASKELVLRVHGPRPDHLRGVVFNRYLNGRWVPGEADPGKPVVLSNQPDDGAGAVRVEAVKPGPRYFVPLDAEVIATPPGLALVDRMGAYRAPTGATAETIWFVSGTQVQRSVQAPAEDDTVVPARWRSQLQQLAESWSAGAQGDAARLRAIEARFQKDFRYALEHERRTNADPIVDFLVVHRVGHCEYFASGMALLARSLGIPARVVSGFRVREYNRLGGFHVVRGRDAHAWVEAWVDGAWRTYDPTPASALASFGTGTTPWAGAIWDWAGDRWSRVDGAQVRLGLFGSSAVLASGAALVLWLRRRRRDRADSTDGSRPALEEVTEMLTALASLGLQRHPAETLESYASRLREHDSERLEAAAEIVERYARFAYGRIGNPAELRSVARAWVRNRRRRRR